VRDSRENYSSKSSGKVIVIQAQVCQTMPGQKMDIMTSARILSGGEGGDFLEAHSLIQAAPSYSLGTISPQCAAASPAVSAVLTTRSAGINISLQNTTKKVFIALFREGNREKNYPLFSAAGGHLSSSRAVPNPERNPRAKER